MKRNHSSDSSVSVKGNIDIGGDSAIGKNAKIIKNGKKLSLFEILVGIVTITAGIVTIYSCFKNN